MALITLGSGITGIRGKIGGTVYQGSASGTISKNRGYRPNKSSYQSDKAKTSISVLNQKWSSLSTAEKQLWANFAIFKPTQQHNGTGRFLNGQQCFLLYNYALYTYDGTIVTSPTFDTAHVLNYSFTIVNDGSQLYVRASSSIDEAETLVVFKISCITKNGVKSAKAGVKYIRLFFNGSYEVDITDAYNLLYGQPATIGSYVECEFQIFKVDSVNWLNKYRQIYQVAVY